MKKIISQLLALQTSELASPKTTDSDSSAMRKQIPAEILARFDKFIGRGKKGIALVQNGVCRGCQIQVPVGVINTLMDGAAMPHCGNCGRFLYLLDEDAQIFRDRKDPDKLVIPRLMAPSLMPKVIRPSKKKAKRVA